MCIECRNASCIIVCPLIYSITDLVIIQTWICLHCATFSSRTTIKRWSTVSLIFFWFQNCECKIQATIWGDAAKDSYSPKDVPAYVTNILGPMRKYYVNEKRAGKELLVSNIEVSSHVMFLFNRRAGLSSEMFVSRQDPLDTMHLRKTLQS